MDLEYTHDYRKSTPTPADTPTDSRDDNGDDEEQAQNGGGGGGGGGGSFGTVAPATETPTGTPTATPLATDEATPTRLEDTTVVDVTFEKRNIRPSENAVILVTVRNPHSTPDTHLVELELFEQIVNSREVTVPPGGETTVEFVHNIVAPGSYTARVDSETATVRVLAPGETPVPTTASTTSTQFPGFGPVVVLISITFAIILSTRQN